MEQTLDFIQVAQNVVLHPGVESMLPLLGLSFLNDLIGIFPFALVLAGQFLFFDTSFSLAFMAKLLVFVAVPVGVGSALGSIPVYVVSYFGGKPAIQKFQKYLRFSWSDVERMNSQFKGLWYDELLFLFLRSVPVLPSLPLNIAAGVLRMRFWPYMVLSIVGLTLRMMFTLLIVGIGTGDLSHWLSFLYND
jgi:membrane protein YqaA with SNARE-associated domain